MMLLLNRCIVVIVRVNNVKLVLVWLCGICCILVRNMVF